MDFEVLHFEWRNFVDIGKVQFFYTFNVNRYDSRHCKLRYIHTDIRKCIAAHKMYSHVWKTTPGSWTLVSLDSSSWSTQGSCQISSQAPGGDPCSGLYGTRLPECGVCSFSWLSSGDGELLLRITVLLQGLLAAHPLCQLLKFRFRIPIKISGFGISGHIDVGWALLLADSTFACLVYGGSPCQVSPWSVRSCYQSLENGQQLLWFDRSIVFASYHSFKLEADSKF